MTKTLILGSGGMLGSTVASVLSQNPDLDLTVTARNEDSPGAVEFDAGRDSVADLVDRVDPEWIVNAIGVIKPRIDESDPASVALAIDVNSAFPHRLAESLRDGQRMIQIATDCVYSGVTGSYDETSAHDPLDVYGKSKSLGEVPASGVTHLRCSIIGPEQGQPRSLLGWFLSQEKGATLTGFTNHRWNGVTTLQFAKLCEAMIVGEIADLPSPLHLVPGDAVNKAELLQLMSDTFDRGDLAIEFGEGGTAVDRTLATVNPRQNERLWAAAGYSEPPTIAAMVEELAETASSRLLAGT